MKKNFKYLRSSHIISFFKERDQECFEIEEVYNAYPNASKGSVRELLSSMSNRGVLSRLKEGLYLIIPLGENKDAYMPEWHSLTKYLVKNEPFYIGYYSALQIISMA